MDAFEHKGLWWFPQFPKHQVSGSIKFDPIDGAFLDILGGEFTSEITELFGIPDQPYKGATLLPNTVVVDIICGYTEKGDAVTLWKCRRGGFNLATGYIGETYKVQAVLIGCHFEKEEDISFDSISIQYTYLEQWLGITGFTGGFKVSPQGEFLDGNIQYAPPQRINIHVNNFEIAFYHKLRVATDRFVDIHATQSTFLEITPENPIHYNKYQSDIIYHLRNFLSLGVGTAVLPLVVKGRKENCITEDSIGENTSCDVFIFYSAKGARLSEKKVQSWEMFFRYEDIADNFKNHLQNWFNEAEKLRPVFDLYFGIFYIPSMYAHLEFLTLAQALESYHRRTYGGGGYMTSEQYENIREILIQAIPPEVASNHRDSLKQRIKYGYEYSLRKRIQFILKERLAAYRPTLDRLLGDYKVFTNKLVDTRNYLTHYTEELEHSAITDPGEQHSFVEKMKLLMLLCLFVEIRLPAEAVHRIMTDNNTFNIWSE